MDTTEIPLQSAASDQIEISPQLRREFVTSIRVTADLFTGFATTGELDLSLALKVTSQHRCLLKDDFHAAVTLSVQPLYDSYPVRHSVQASLLSMAMGIDAGFSEEELQTIGIGSLVHDIGMLLVPTRLLTADTMTERDRQDLMRHPSHAVDALDRQPAAPADSRFVAGQIHERLDGTGYPQALRGSAIHRLARYAGVADTFLGMIAPRPHRAGHQPYRAMEEILFAARRGRFDSAAVRTLLRVVSLYPVGSCVWLSDGRMARVLQSNPDAVDRPIVLALDLDRDPPDIQRLNLAENPGIRVVQVGELTSIERTSGHS